jgi:preprotein translocase subunit SecE
MGNVFGFFRETARELKKTSWPTRKDLIRSSVVVLVGTALVGSYVAIADFSLFQVISLLMDTVR